MTRRSPRVPVATIISCNTVVIEPNIYHHHHTSIHASTCRQHECAHQVTSDINITGRSGLHEQDVIEARANSGGVVHIQPTATAVDAHDHRRQRMRNVVAVGDATDTAAVSDVEVGVSVSEAAASDDMTHGEQGTQQTRAQNGRRDEHATKHAQSHKRKADDAYTRAAVAVNMRTTQDSCNTISSAPAMRRNHADDVEAADHALTEQTAAVALATVVNERRAIVTARSGRGRDCGPGITASDSRSTCNEMSIPASPELLVKINKNTRGNIRKYEQKVRELRGYIKRTEKKLNNTAYRDKQQAYICKRRQQNLKRTLKTALARVKRDSEFARTNSSTEAGGTARKRRSSDGATVSQ